MKSKKKEALRKDLLTKIELYKSLQAEFEERGKDSNLTDTEKQQALEFSEAINKSLALSEEGRNTASWLNYYGFTKKETAMIEAVIIEIICKYGSLLNCLASIIFIDADKSEDQI